MDIQDKIYVYGMIDMSEDRKDLGGQRMAQLLDGQITSLDVKCVQGIQVKCPKIIMTMNTDFDFEDSPEKFRARVCRFRVNHHLTLKKIDTSKFEVRDVEYSKHGMRCMETGEFIDE